MPEGEKHWRGPVVIGGENLPSPVQVGLTDLQNIGGASGPPAPPVPAPLLNHTFDSNYTSFIAALFWKVDSFIHLTLFF